MSDLASPRADRELQILDTLVDCAYALSMVLGEAAKAETDRNALLKLSDAFQRSFQGVRLGIRLAHSLSAPPKAAAATAVKQDASEIETIEVERTESAEAAERLDRTDGGTRLDVERERDRDYEPVSLSRLLATLGVVATQAERMADRLPAEVAAQTLPTLRELLARAKAAPPGAGATPAPAAVLTRPRPPAPKAALLGSASAPPTRPVILGGLALARPPPRRRR